MTDERGDDAAQSHERELYRVDLRFGGICILTTRRLTIQRDGDTLEQIPLDNIRSVKTLFGLTGTLEVQLVDPGRGPNLVKVEAQAKMWAVAFEQQIKAAKARLDASE